MDLSVFNNALPSTSAKSAKRLHVKIEREIILAWDKK
jgi:hypothetical protein